jgi:hypothetical protein
MHCHTQCCDDSARFVFDVKLYHGKVLGSWRKDEFFGVEELARIEMSCVDGWFFSCADTKLNFPRDKRIGDVVGNGCFGRKWFDEADRAGDDFGFFAESGE